MATGPFYGKLPHYQLTFQPDTAGQHVTDADGRVVRDDYGDPVSNPGYTGQPFILEAHLSSGTLRDAQRIGRDTAEGVIDILFCNPKEGDERIRHESVCTVSPDWRGLKGTLTIQAEPESGFYKVTEKIGVSLLALFKEG